MKQLFFFLFAFCSLLSARAAEQITFGGYTEAIELRNEKVRVILCPEVGGRVLEYSLDGKNALYLSDADRNWKRGDRPQSSAGRFDIGPELTIPQHRDLWSGEWTGDITGQLRAGLSQWTVPRPTRSG